nr:hypothetical protein B0A51_09289 [Rachicladosporium sp. CCFEE 5018]
MTGRAPSQDLPLRNRQASRTSTDIFQDTWLDDTAHGPSHGTETSQAQSGRRIYVDGAQPDRATHQSEIGFVSSHPHGVRHSHHPFPSDIAAPEAQELQRITAEALLLVDERGSPQRNQPATEEARRKAEYLAGTQVGVRSHTASADIALPPGFGNGGSLPEGSPNGGYDNFGPLHYAPLPEGWWERAISPQGLADAEDVTAEQISVVMLPSRENSDQSSGRQATAHPASRQAAQPKRICSRTITGFYPNGGHDPGGPLWFADKSDAGDQAAESAAGPAYRGTADAAALPSRFKTPRSWRAAEGWPDDGGEDEDGVADRMDDH